MTIGSSPSLVSIQVGRPRSLGLLGATAVNDRPWTTGIFKEWIEGPVFLGPEGLDGDGQADLVNHGGPDKAVCVYSADHYPTWRRTSVLAHAEHGAFGENFTVAGLTEDAVCIGDVWSVADASVQISQPRQPCWKLGRKWHSETLPDEVVRSGRTGWYFRVLQEGVVTAGDRLTLVERPHPDWTVTRANQTMHGRPYDLDESAALATVIALSGSWKASLTRRLTSGVAEF